MLGDPGAIPSNIQQCVGGWVSAVSWSMNPVMYRDHLDHSQLYSRDYMMLKVEHRVSPIQGLHPSPLSSLN